MRGKNVHEPFHRLPYRRTYVTSNQLEVQAGGEPSEGNPIQPNGTIALEDIRRSCIGEGAWTLQLRLLHMKVSMGQRRNQEQGEE